MVRPFAFVVVTVAMAGVSGCTVAAPNAGHQAVWMEKPFFFGHGGVDQTPVTAGREYGAITSEAIDGSDFRRHDPRFHGPDLDRNLRQVAALRDLAAGLGVTPGQLALAWLLAQGPDVVPIPGSRRPDRVAQNAAAADIRLSDADLRGANLENADLGNVNIEKADIQGVRNAPKGFTAWALRHHAAE